MGNRKIDERFIKKYFTSPEIICALDSDPFNLPLELSGYKPRKTTDWQNYSCILPVSLDLHNEKYIIYPISNPVIEGGYMVNTLIDDGDFAIISSKSIGSVYQYVEKDISVNGMESSIVKPVFIRKPLSVDDIELIMTSIAETQYDGSIIGLDKAITILDRVNYVSGIESFVKKYLKVTHDARGLNELSKKYRKSQWVRNIRSLLVEVLSELPHESRLALCKSISSANLTINGQQAGFAMRSTDNKENVELADHLLKISSPLTRDELLVNLNIADIVAEYIQDGQSLEQPVSEVFKNMNYASISLKMLKEFTGGDLSDYFYSYEKILPENKGKIIKYAQDLSINLGLLHEVVPSDSLDDLIDLAKVYSDIALTVDDSLEIDYRKVNGRLFGINMRIRVEDDLKRLLNDTFSNLETLILNSSKIYIDSRNRIKLIDSTQVKVLNDIRHFGNSCAHNKVIPIHEQDELDHWVDVVDEVELAINNYLAQQVS